MAKIKIQASGIIYNEVTEPAVVYEQETGTLYKIGEKKVMEKYYKEVQEKYQLGGFPKEAENVRFMELPPNQELVDKIFQNSGYLKRFVDEMEKQLIS